MTIRALTNDGWGFASCCFVCEPTNEAGLRIPFFHDEARELVFADFTLDARFSGAPQYLHGGVTLAILDEAVAWAAIAISGKFAVTRETSTIFERPVRVGVPYRVQAVVVGTDAERITAHADVLDERRRARASARAELVVVGSAHAADAVGAPVGDDLSGFLR